MLQVYKEQNFETNLRTCVRNLSIRLVEWQFYLNIIKPRRF
jgi:hypothetical protein